MFLLETEEQEALRSTLRDLFARVCPPELVRAVKAPDHDGVPADLWRTLARTGLFGLVVDPEYGGDGATLGELGILFDEGGRVLCPTAVYSTCEFAVALGRLGTDAQKKDLLPAVATGELKGCVATWNQQDAADVRPRLVAEHTSAGWALSGEIMFAPNAAVADRVLVTASTTGFADEPRTYAFLVEPGGAGWSCEPLHSLAGDKQARIVLDRVPVDRGATITGPDGTGLAEDDLRWVAHACLALQCAEAAGGASAVLDRTVEYVKTREQFGRSLGSFQAVQHHVADMRIAVEAARLAATQAVWWIGHGDLATRRLAVAVMHTSEAYKRCTLTAHQLHGGMGLSVEGDLHLWSERAKVTEVRGGTADVAARWLQRELGLVP